jgi:VWFA-related protein
MTAFRRLLSIAGGVWLLGASDPSLRLRAQTPPADSGATIKTETRLVIVDTVVTDKKGAYVQDLKQKNFRVFEDGKEMDVKSFSSEAEGAASGKSQQRYIVLFFDNSTMDPPMQVQARQAASKFIDSNANPRRLMAVVNFGGSLQIAQNFTSNAERLKSVVSGVKFSSTSPNPNEATAALASVGNTGLSQAAAEFGARSVIVGLRSLAKNLATVPGRKSLILLTGGFNMSNEDLSELTALINVCNKSNVAVYPIDARGLAAPGGARLFNGAPNGPEGESILAASVQNDAIPPVGYASNADQSASRSFLRLASFMKQAASAFAAQPGVAFAWAPPSGGAAPPSSGGGGRSPGAGAPPSSSSPPSGGGKSPGNPGVSNPGRGAPGVGAPGTGTSGKGSPGTGRGGGGATFNPNNPIYNNPLNQPRQILPRFQDSASTNQQFMYALATGTGGFVIVNTNDLLAGLEKIGREQNEYYLLGYTPPESVEGSCHTIQVKIVDHGGTQVRSRTGYCNARPQDLLAGSSVEKGLEAIASGTAQGALHASMLAPYFYTSTNVARVNVAMEIPSEKLRFEKEKGKFGSSIHVLGLVQKTDGTIAARFSDTLKLHLENKKEVETFKENPLHYESQFDVASGQYTLKVAFSSGGENFGRVETPLVIDPYDGKQFSISGVAFSRSFVKVAEMDTDLDAAMIEDRKILVSRGIQIIPSGSTQIKKSDKALLYLEVYAPALLLPNYPMVGLRLRIVDSKTGVAVDDTGLMNLAAMIKPGNPVIPVGMGVPLEKLTPGKYRAEVQARDAAGHTTALRAAEFDLQ